MEDRIQKTGVQEIVGKALRAGLAVEGSQRLARQGIFHVRNSEIETADSADFTDFEGVIEDEPTNLFAAKTQGIDNRNLLHPRNLWNPQLIRFRF